jgi:phosphoserine phosphatase
MHSSNIKSAKKLALSLKGEIESKKNHYRIHTKMNFVIDGIRASSQEDLNTFDYDFDYKNIKLMVSDMDSTLISIETIDEVAKTVGLSEEVSSITEEAMQGQLDFSESFKKRLLILKGVCTSSFDEVFINQMKLNSGVKELIGYFNSNDIKTALVSGGITYFAEKLKNQLKMDTFKANEVEFSNQRITGKVIGNVVDANEKANYILELCNHYNINTEQVVAIGDGANDVEMMKKAGLSVAYRGKPILKKNCAVQINYRGLDCLIDFFEDP